MKTNFDFESFIEKLKDLFIGFTFEEIKHSNEVSSLECLCVAKPMYGCCAFLNPIYYSAEKDGCIITQLFNSQRKNLNLAALLIIPIELFDNGLLMTNIKQLLRFHIDERSPFFAKASLNSMIEIISSIETILNQDATIQITVKTDKMVLNRKELIEYLA